MNKPITDKLILGSVQFGQNYGINNQVGQPREPDVFNILAYAKENGIHTLDTAPDYGNAVALIGRFHEENHSRFQVNTKFKIVTGQKLHDQVVHALKQLAIDKIHIYFYHRFNDMIEHPNTLAELMSMKEEGRIQKIGISVYGNDQFRKAIEQDQIDVIQVPFNLLDNCYQKGKLLEQAKLAGKEIQVRSVFLQGLFFKDIANLPLYLKPLSPYLEKISQICQRIGISKEILAISFVAFIKEIDNILIGVDSIDQLKRNMNSDYVITEDIVEEINHIRVQETYLLNPVNWK